MAIVLGAADFVQIRSLLALSLSADMLPDNIIALDVFLGQGCDYVDRRTTLPGVGDVIDGPGGAVTVDASALGVYEGMHRRAILYRTAGNLCGTIPQLLGESVGGFAQRHESVSWQVRQEHLYGMCEREVEELQFQGVEDAEDVARESVDFVLFGVTSGSGLGRISVSVQDIGYGGSVGYGGYGGLF